MMISGQIEERDFVRAAFVHIRPRQSLAFLGVVLVALGLGVAIWALGDLAEDRQRGVLGLCILLVFTYLGVYFGLWYPFRARRLFRQDKAVGLPFTAEIREDGIHVESELGGGLVPWPHIRKWREGSSVFLLYPSDALYHIFPKSVFSASSGDQFRTTLLQRLGPAA